MGTKVQNSTERCQIQDRHVLFPLSLFFDFFVQFIHQRIFIQNCLLDVKLNAQGYGLHTYCQFVCFVDVPISINSPAILLV